MGKRSAHVRCAAPGSGPEAAVEACPPLVPLVSAAGTDPDSAIADLAGMYAGRCWHSTRLDDDYWYRYVAIGDAEVSIRRWQLHGYLRGDAAVDGEVVVQWTDTGRGRIAVGQNEKQLEPGIPTLFPIEQRFEMEYPDADQRLVHISRALVLDVASEQYLTTGVVTFDRKVPPAGNRHRLAAGSRQRGEHAPKRWRDVHGMA